MENLLPDQARFLEAVFGPLTIVNLYVVNGKTVNDPAYQIKLQWLTRLIEWVMKTHSPKGQLILTGDFNIAPADEDTYDPAVWHERNLCTTAEREFIKRLTQWGLVDVHAHKLAQNPKEERFTWWDYRAGSFHKNWGLRLDLMLATSAVTDRCKSITVDREERKQSTGPGKPSDHAPLIATFEPITGP
jgi:exodeoxyribonuclease-3